MFHPKIARKCQFLAENSVFLARTVSCRAPPTETCSELYRGNLSGHAGPPAQNKISFRPNMAKKCPFFAQNSVFLAGVVSCRAPYPISRVLDQRKCVGNCIGAAFWMFQSLQHQKKKYFLPKNDQRIRLKQCFLGPEKSLKRGNFQLSCLISGPNPVFRVCRMQTKTGVHSRSHLIAVVSHINCGFCHFFKPKKEAQTGKFSFISPDLGPASPPPPLL